MSKLLLAAISSALLIGSAPLAGELESDFNWAGFYAGASIGHGQGSTLVGPIFMETFPIQGTVGGVQLGYNHALNGFILGAEVDYSFSGPQHSERAFGATSTWRIDNFGSLRARLGIAADRLMPYVTGGVAVGSESFTVVAGAVLEASQTHIGWTLGAGVEYAVADTVTLRGEYLHTDLGTALYKPDWGLPFDSSVNFGAVRGGINFKF